MESVAMKQHDRVFGIGGQAFLAFVHVHCQGDFVGRADVPRVIRSWHRPTLPSIFDLHDCGVKCTMQWTLSICGNVVIWQMDTPKNPPQEGRIPTRM
eukprot:scaffold1420_cov375-Pavlova_lutheri.AAC.18